GGLLEIEEVRGGRSEGDDVRAGVHRARDAQMTLHPVGPVRQILVDVVGAVFLGERVKQIERRVVVMRIAGDHLAAKFPLEEIERPISERSPLSPAAYYRHMRACPRTRR